MREYVFIVMLDMSLHIARVFVATLPKSFNMFIESGLFSYSAKKDIVIGFVDIGHDFYIFYVFEYRGKVQGSKGVLVFAQYFYDISK